MLGRGRIHHGRLPTSHPYSGRHWEPHLWPPLGLPASSLLGGHPHGAVVTSGWLSADPMHSALPVAVLVWMWLIRRIEMMRKMARKLLDILEINFDIVMGS